MSEFPDRAGAGMMGRKGRGPGEMWMRRGQEEVTDPAETGEMSGAILSLSGRWQQD